VDDLKRLPFTSKFDLQVGYPFAFFAVPREQVVLVLSSSGTTGRAVPVGYTARDTDLWAGLVARSLAAVGVGPGDVVQNACGYGLFTGGLGYHQGAQRVGATVLPTAAGHSERQVTWLFDLGTTVLCATPGYLLALAETAADMGRDLRSSRLRVGMMGGEPASEAMREAIEARLGIRAVDTYGLSEMFGPGVSYECPHRAGLHVNEDHFIPEVVDPATGNPLPDGETGELVLTALTKEAMPLLRFRTGDLTGLDRAPCPCGRTTARMGRVAGRCDDMLIVRGVNVFPSAIEQILLSGKEPVPHFQIVLDRDRRHLDTLTIRVEAPAGGVDRTGFTESLRRRLHQSLGLRIDVEAVDPGTIPRPTGKAVRVIDRRREAVMP
jgi:phenylacetate-CoA ligase